MYLCSRSSKVTQKHFSEPYRKPQRCPVRTARKGLLIISPSSSGRATLTSQYASNICLLLFFLLFFWIENRFSQLLLEMSEPLGHCHDKDWRAVVVVRVLARPPRCADPPLNPVRAAAAGPGHHGNPRSTTFKACPRLAHRLPFRSPILAASLLRWLGRPRAGAGTHSTPGRWDVHVAAAGYPGYHGYALRL